MFSNNFIKKVAAFSLVLCMGAGSLDLTAFAATPTETAETDTSGVGTATGKDVSTDTDANVSVLSDETVEEVSDLYTEDDLSEAAKTLNTAGLLVQLKDTEGTLPSITYNSTNSVNLSNGLYAVTFASTEEAEAAKKELSSATTTNINLPFITATAEGPKHFDMNLTRAKFDELTADLVDRTKGPVNTALADAGLTAADLDKVLLVGGSTRIIAVQEEVKRLTGKEPFKGINPDECVAIGACIQGGKLAGDAGAGEILLLDVTPLTLSIETMGGIATHLIERNTTIPTKKSQIFSTAQDNQDAVDINVVQGERQFAKDNKSLGRFRLDGIAPARRGVPQIEVTFDIDANGIVNVSAKDLGTGREQHITITSGTSLSDDDIDRAVKEAAEYEAQDKKRKEGIEARNEADALAFQTEKALGEVGDKLSDSDKAGVKADLDSLRAAIDSTDAENMSDADVDKIKAAKDKLMESAQNLFSKLYEQNGPGANAGTGAGTPDYSDGDVVDGDFTEV